jgi:hypothetical protein
MALVRMTHRTRAKTIRLCGKFLAKLVSPRTDNRLAFERE